MAPGGCERRLVAAVHALAAAPVGAWLASHGGGPLLLGVPAAALLGAWFGWNVLRPLRGSLRWDGRGWWHVPHTGAAHPLHSVDLMMDLGGWFLLRVCAEQLPRRLVAGAWCGVSRRDAGAGWHGLRLALYQARGSAALALPSDQASG